MKKKAEELIRNLVPELRELKTGCIVEGFTGNGNIVLITDKNIILSWCDDALTSIPLDKFDKDCIIGQEINIEHIAIACERKYASSIYYSFELSFYKELARLERCVIDAFTGKEDFEACYSPLSSFQEQSEEFYEFIVKILG